MPVASQVAQNGDVVQFVFPVQVEVRATSQSVDVQAITDEVLSQLAAALPRS